MNDTSSSVQSIDRVLNIMELLAAYPLGLSLTEIAKLTKLHPSTAHRLLSTLIHRGYVCKLETAGNYRLTLRMLELGGQVANQSGVLPVARPIVEELATTTGALVHLVLRDGSQVVYVYKTDSSLNLANMGSRIGLRNPMYCTSVGKSILALLPPEEVKAIWADEEIIPYTSTTIVRLEDMNTELAATRARGYAIDNEEHEVGIGCVAAAIRNFAGQPIAAVSISSLIHRIKESEAELSAMVIAVADKVSRLLGYIPKQEGNLSHR